MATAIVLLAAAGGRVSEIAEHLAGLEKIAEACSVAGRHDPVAIGRVKRNEHLADVFTQKPQRVDGIQSAETLIAFRACSRMDLDGGFSIGFAGN